MSRLRHLVAKDFRRVRWVWAAWLAAGVTLSAVVAWWSPDVPASDFERVLRAWDRFAWYVRAAMVALGAGAFLLGGFMMLEDSPMGSDSFWQTRPVSGARLLVAKAVLATLLLVVAPVLTLVPLWLMAGFATAQIGMLAVVLAGALAVIGLVGMVCGAMSMDLGELAFAGLSVVSAGALVLVFPEPFVALDPVARQAGYHSSLLATWLVLPVLLTFLVLQFVRRAGVRWWTVVGGVLPVALVARVAWPAGLAAPERLPWPPGPLQVAGARTGSSGTVALEVRSPRDSINGTWLAAWSARGVLLDEGDRPGRALTFLPEAAWGEEAARWVADNRKGSARLGWPLESVREEAREAAPVFRGEVTVAPTTVEVLARVPLAVGSTGGDGGHALGVQGIRQADGVVELLVREREAAVSRSPGADEFSRDLYFLQPAGTDRPLLLRIHARAAARAGLIDSRLIHLTTGAGEERVSGGSMAGAGGQFRDALLVRVRLRRGTSWIQSVPELKLGLPAGKGAP